MIYLMDNTKLNTVHCSADESVQLCSIRPVLDQDKRAHQWPLFLRAPPCGLGWRYVSRWHHQYPVPRRHELRCLPGGLAEQCIVPIQPCSLQPLLSAGQHPQFISMCLMKHKTALSVFIGNILSLILNLVPLVHNKWKGSLALWACLICDPWLHDFYLLDALC